MVVWFGEVLAVSVPVSVGAGPQGLPGTPSGASTPAGASTGPSRLVGSVARVRRRRRWRARQTPAARRATVVESAKSDLRPRARGAVLGEATWLMASNLMVSPHWQGESPCTRICVDRFESAPRRPFRPVVGMTIKPHSRDVDAPNWGTRPTTSPLLVIPTREWPLVSARRTRGTDGRPTGFPKLMCQRPKCGHPADSNGFRRSQRHDFSLPDHGRRPRDAPKSAASVGTRGAPKDDRLPAL